jgi:hypothetical protein
MVRERHGRQKTSPELPIVADPKASHREAQLDADPAVPAADIDTQLGGETRTGLASSVRDCKPPR